MSSLEDEVSPTLGRMTLSVDLGLLDSLPIGHPTGAMGERRPLTVKLWRSLVTWYSMLNIT